MIEFKNDFTEILEMLKTSNDLEIILKHLKILDILQLKIYIIILVTLKLMMIDNKRKKYMIQGGDTLSGIAAKFGTIVEELCINDEDPTLWPL